MNLDDNKHKIDNFMNTSNNFKTLVMGIMLLVATICLMSSNIFGVTFAQGISNKNLNGCTHIVQVTLSNLHQQTENASTQVTLYNIGPNFDRGLGIISIPEIGSGIVKLGYNLQSNGYGAYISDFHRKLPLLTLLFSQVTLFVTQNLLNQRIYLYQGSGPAR